MIQCEVCTKQIEDDKEIEVRLSEETYGQVGFYVHEKCVVGMGVTARKLLQELRHHS